MQFVRQRMGRWTAPVLVSAGLLVVGGIGTAVAVKSLSKKQVVKTINKKVQGHEIQVAGPKDAEGSFNQEAPGALMAELKLPAGNYMVSSTATVTKAAGQAVQCQLRVGNKVDKTDLSGAVALNQDMALGASGNVPANGSAQLRCVDGSAASDGKVSNIEISALKVPKLTLSTG